MFIFFLYFLKLVTVLPNLKYTNALPVHVGVSELPVGILGIIEQFVLTIELDISNSIGNFAACTAGLESAILDWFGCGHINWTITVLFFGEIYCMHSYCIASIQV